MDLSRKSVKEKAEKKRLYQLFQLERANWEKGFNLVAGVDEVGRGTLAGPVVAAAVIFKKDEYIEGLTDSKKIPEIKRYLLEQKILAKAYCYSIGVVDNEVIDQINIRNATFKAMIEAITSLSEQPDLVLVDGFEIPQLSFKQLAVIKGDLHCASIAAASILAKCFRDRLMLQYHRIYPYYSFDLHKGYGTKIHYDALGLCGSSPLHRQTFLVNWMKQKNES